MRLAFIIFRYFPFGGLQRDFKKIAEACLKKGHTVHVFTMKWEGSEFSQIPITRIPCNGITHHRRIANFIKILTKYLSREKFDRIVGFNKMPGLDIYYAADSCFKLASTEKYPFLSKVLSRYRTYNALEKSVFNPTAATKILLLCKKQQEEFINFYKTPLHRMVILPPGVAKIENIPKKNNLENKKILLFVGSGFRTKGLDRAIYAFHSLPISLRKNTHFIIIGSDHLYPYQKLCKKLGLTSFVSFLGGQYNVIEWMMKADLLIHPARRENTGTVLLEALTAGLPVLTTEVCGYAHYILESNSGKVLASPFKQQELNKSLNDMLTSNLQKTWRHNALKFADSADIYRLVDSAVLEIEKFP